MTSATRFRVHIIERSVTIEKLADGAVGPANGPFATIEDAVEALQDRVSRFEKPDGMYDFADLETARAFALENLEALKRHLEASMTSIRTYEGATRFNIVSLPRH